MSDPQCVLVVEAGLRNNSYGADIRYPLNPDIARASPESPPPTPTINPRTSPLSTNTLLTAPISNSQTSLQGSRTQCPLVPHS